MTTYYCYLARKDSEDTMPGRSKTIPTEQIQKLFGANLRKRLEPQVNFRIARFYLRGYKQKNTENIDDFVARCRLQAKKCRFRDNQETEERLIEQIITGTRHPELQKLLLSKGMELTLQEAINSSRMHEAFLNYMR